MALQSYWQRQAGFEQTSVSIESPWQSVPPFWAGTLSRCSAYRGLVKTLCGVVGTFEAWWGLQKRSSLFWTGTLSRLRVRTPLPHVALQADQSFQLPHEQSTANDAKDKARTEQTKRTEINHTNRQFRSVYFCRFLHAFTSSINSTTWLNNEVT